MTDEEKKTGVFEQPDLSAVPGLGSPTSEEAQADSPISTESSESSPSNDRTEMMEASEIRDRLSGTINPDAPPSEEIDFGSSSTPPPPGDSLAPTRQFADQIHLGRNQSHAAYPFSLLITGRLSNEDRDKLLSVLSRENMGISESDLETQFANDRVLIPRISEYAGVMIVQAIRATQAEIRLGPSDEIFATDDTRTAYDEGIDWPEKDRKYSIADSVHEAENLPLTPGASIPTFRKISVIDTLAVSASLKTQQVESERSAEYQEILEALTRELKYRAYRKGAAGVIHFTIKLDPLITPGRYRLTVLGTAIRHESET